MRSYDQTRAETQQESAASCSERLVVNEPERGREEGKRAARYFGAEYQANPGSDRLEYYESIAWYYEKGSWAEMSDDERQEAIFEFNEGIKRERRAQGSR
jgi:hypothetical protein